MARKKKEVVEKVEEPKFDPGLILLTTKLETIPDETRLQIVEYIRQQRLEYREKERAIAAGEATKRGRKKKPGDFDSIENIGQLDLTDMIEA